MSGDENREQLWKSVEDRVLTLERQVFGDDISSRIQQQRKVIKLNQIISLSFSNFVYK